ncbi:hypothetical protein AB835_06325 [Candidatus Endobugula sertula]|uniref:Uncharacterized protein n=1 Tax=Candidatus Endobugula sertula TaxID=62101 RepID=A0A1D2QQT5_9GAMM|nr:hypothetical protein AB835_06325 [Candidatus Endobugula sertula]
MSHSKDLLNKRKKSLLVELESIKHLLDDNPSTIPILKDAVVEKESTAYVQILEDNIPPNTESKPISGSKCTEKQLTHHASEQKALFNVEQASQKAGKEVLNKPQTTPPMHTEKNVSGKTLSNNPFLPDHVRKRLDQKSATLTSAESPESPKSHSQHPHDTEQLIEQLVAQYLPKIEAELRARLLAAVKPQKNGEETSL